MRRLTSSQTYSKSSEIFCNIHSRRKMEHVPVLRSHFLCWRRKSGMAEDAEVMLLRSQDMSVGTKEGEEEGGRDG